MARSGIKRIVLQIGVACFVVSFAWLLQVVGIKSDDGAASQVLWSLTAALIFGFGLGFFLIGYLWCA